MKTLILSCSTGEGHNSCAKAIKEVYDLHGDECVIADGLAFISDRASRVLSKGHVFVYRHIPRLFSWGYGFTEDHAAIFKERSRVYSFFARGADALCQYILEQGFDSIICTHPFTSLMMTETQRRYNLPVSTAFVATDYTCSPSVKESRMDYYFIPDKKLSAEFECTNIPQNKITTSGIPIRQMFYRHTNKSYAKLTHKLPVDRPHIVMMCGSMGCGPIEKLTDVLTRINDNGFCLTVVCGTNDKLKDRLESQYSDRSNLRVLGFVKDMSLLLDSADLYLTKPGGISVSEAAVKRVPMVFINAVSGCEDYNADFFVRSGCAMAGESVDELAHICEDLMSNQFALDAMVQELSRHERHNSAELIYSTMMCGADK